MKSLSLTLAATLIVLMGTLAGCSSFPLFGGGSGSGSHAVATKPTLQKGGEGEFKQISTTTTTPVPTTQPSGYTYAYAPTFNLIVDTPVKAEAFNPTSDVWGTPRPTRLTVDVSKLDLSKLPPPPSVVFPALPAVPVATTTHIETTTRGRQPVNAAGELTMSDRGTSVPRSYPPGSSGFLAGTGDDTSDTGTAGTLWHIACTLCVIVGLGSLIFKFVLPLFPITSVVTSHAPQIPLITSVALVIGGVVLYPFPAWAGLYGGWVLLGFIVALGAWGLEYYLTHKAVVKAKIEALLGKAESDVGLGTPTASVKTTVAPPVSVPAVPAPATVPPAASTTTIHINAATPAAAPAVAGPVTVAAPVTGPFTVPTPATPTAVVPVAPAPLAPITAATSTTGH